MDDPKRPQEAEVRPPRGNTPPDNRKPAPKAVEPSPPSAPQSLPAEADPRASAENAAETIARLERTVRPSPSAQNGLPAPASDKKRNDDGGDSPAKLRFRYLSITFNNVRANSKVFVTIRDNQKAEWSEGSGKGLVGLGISTAQDTVLYLRNFLVNAREMFFQTYNNSQEIKIQLYVRTAQSDLRGRIDLPPGASATLETGTDRTSLIGYSSFAIDF